MTQKQKHPLFQVWRGMIRRCYDEGVKGYHNYGGRGIGVCDQWRYDFWQFVCDVPPRPSLRHTLDRYPDNNGNYEPRNVRWATKAEQARNGRFNRYMTVNNRTQTLEDWARETGLAKSTIENRLQRDWSDAEALITEPQAHLPDNAFFPVGGRDECRRRGVNPYSVASRMRRGWSFERALQTPMAGQKGKHNART